MNQSALIKKIIIFFRKKPNIYSLYLIIILESLLVLKKIIEIVSKSNNDLPPDPQGFLQFTNLIRIGTTTSESISASAGDKTVVIPWLIANISEIIGIAGVTSYLLINIIIFVVPSMILSFIVLDANKNLAGLLLWLTLMTAAPNWTYAYLYFFEAAQIFFFLISWHLLRSNSYFYLKCSVIPVLLLLSFLAKWQTFCVFILLPILVLIYEFMNKQKLKRNVIGIFTMALSLLSSIYILEKNIHFTYNLKIGIEMASGPRLLTWIYGNNGSELGIKNLFLFRIENFLHVLLWYHWGIVPLLLIFAFTLMKDFKITTSLLSQQDKILMVFFILGILLAAKLISWDPRYVIIPNFVFIFLTTRIIKRVLHEK